MGRGHSVLSSIWLGAVACALLAAQHVAAAVPGVALNHYEPLTRLAFRDPRSGAVAKPSAGQPLTMSFDAYGRRFDLLLSPNASLLTQPLRADLSARGIQVYRGQLQGAPDSWVRMVVAGGIPRGTIFDGTELYSIEVPGDSVVDAANGPIIYALTDLAVQPGELGCGAQRVSSANGQVAYANLVSELKTLAATGASLNLELGAVADFEFNESFGAGTQAALIDRFNRVDGIFSRELGIQISLTRVDIFTEDNDPFTASDASDLLRELSAYRSATPAQRSRGLSHLFTGRNLDTSTVGIAYVGALCSSFAGAGLSEGRRGPNTDSLIAAHEIGHNFGASHDGDAGGPCGDAPGGFLMAPSINGSDRFSQCSKDTMAAEIAAASGANGCLAPVADIDVVATLDSADLTVLTGADFSYDLTLDNQGSESATDVAVNIQLPTQIQLRAAEPSAGTCTSGAGVVDCDLGTIAGNSTRSVALTLRATTPGDLAVNVAVTTTTDINTSNNLAAGTITANPAVDLVLAPVADARITQDAAATVRISVNNDSDLTANNVSVSFVLDAGLRADEANFTLGSCTVAASQVDCTGITLSPGSELQGAITVTGVQVGQPQIVIDVSATEADLNGADNSATATITVQTPATAASGGGSGGGGGALLWSLMLLSGLRLVRWSRGAAGRATDAMSPRSP
jgi:hypothetical protein